MRELDKTRIPPEDKTDASLRKRELVEDFLPILYRLTDLSIYLSAMELRDNIVVLIRFRKGISEVIGELRKTWLPKMMELKKECHLRAYIIHPETRPINKGPFYNEVSFFDNRELLGEFALVLEECSNIVSLLKVIEVGLTRSRFLDLYKKILNLITSLREWNMRINEIRIFYEYSSETKIRFKEVDGYVMTRKTKEFNGKLEVREGNFAKRKK